MTREEFVRKAATAILAARYPNSHLVTEIPRALHEWARQDAEAALEAVGAWDLLKALEDTANFYRDGQDCWCDEARGPKSHSGYCLSSRAAIAKAEGR